MSEPRKPNKGMLFASIIYNPEADLNLVIQKLEEKFGEMEFKSREIDFIETDYYADEMGKVLKRIFIAFTDLIERDAIAQKKLITNEIEKEFLKDGHRIVNIDPGLLTSENMNLVTGKNYSHRIYLMDGIFSEITYIFKDKSYKTLEWTYPDYSKKEVIAIFNQMREKYRKLMGC